MTHDCKVKGCSSHICLHSKVNFCLPFALEGGLGGGGGGAEGLASGGGSPAWCVQHKYNGVSAVGKTEANKEVLIFEKGM